MAPQLWSLGWSWMNCRRRGGRIRTVGTLHGVKQWGETPGTRTSRLCPNSHVRMVLSWEKRGSKARKQSPFKSDDINILAQKQAPWLLKIKNKNENQTITSKNVHPFTVTFF